MPVKACFSSTGIKNEFLMHNVPVVFNEERISHMLKEFRLKSIPLVSPIEKITARGNVAYYKVTFENPTEMWRAFNNLQATVQYVDQLSNFFLRLEVSK